MKFERLSHALERWRLARLSDQAGYPIASRPTAAVSARIEGACRHLVKDRRERTGMRWRGPSAGSMLFARALEVTNLWEPFQTHRQAVERKRLHPHHARRADYTPNLAIAL